MAKPKFGSARIDENGKITGGKAGDQNGGKEVSTQDWYSRNWRVFRPKDYGKAKKIAAFMKALCASPNVGYDQNQRNTLRNELIKNGYDVSKIPPCETDCSAAVRECLESAGIHTPEFNTESEPKVLASTGAFVELTDSKYRSSGNYLLPGDILVTATKGHTGAMLTKGDKAKEPALPPTTEPPKAEGGLRVIGSTVNLRSGPGTGYPIVGTVKKDDLLTKVSTEGWRSVLVDGKVLWISEAYILELK